MKNIEKGVVLGKIHECRSRVLDAYDDTYVYDNMPTKKEEDKFSKALKIISRVLIFLGCSIALYAIAMPLFGIQGLSNTILTAGTCTVVSLFGTYAIPTSLSMFKESKKHIKQMDECTKVAKPINEDRQLLSKIFSNLSSVLLLNYNSNFSQENYQEAKSQFVSLNTDFLNLILVAYRNQLDDEGKRIIDTYISEEDIASNPKQLVKDLKVLKEKVETLTPQLYAVPEDFKDEVKNSVMNIESSLSKSIPEMFDYIRISDTVYADVEQQYLKDLTEKQAAEKLDKEQKEKEYESCIEELDDDKFTF